MDELFEPLSLGKARRRSLAMFKDSPNKIVRDADIKRAARVVREDVNEIVRHRGESSWIAGSGPAMTREEDKATQQESIRSRARTHKSGSVSAAR